MGMATHIIILLTGTGGEIQEEEVWVKQGGLHVVNVSRSVQQGAAMQHT